MEYFTLEILGQGHKNRSKSNQVIYTSGPFILPKWKRYEKLLESYRVNISVWPAAEEEPLKLLWSVVEYVVWCVEI